MVPIPSKKYKHPKFLSKLLFAISRRNSRRKAALDMFQKLGSNDTRIHFKIEKTRDPKGEGRGDVHQAHDANGKKLEWEAQSGGTGKFDGMANYIQDKNGNFAYKKATITIYETTVNEGFARGSGSSLNDWMVAVFTHEGDHNTNQEAINEITMM